MKTSTRYEQVLKEVATDCALVSTDQRTLIRSAENNKDIWQVIVNLTLDAIGKFFATSFKKLKDEGLVGDREFWKQILSKFYARECARMFALDLFSSLTRNARKQYLKEDPWLELDPEGWSCHMVENWIEMNRPKDTLSGMGEV